MANYLANRNIREYLFNQRYLSAAGKSVFLYRNVK
jgi:hypothetical protein